MQASDPRAPATRTFQILTLAALGMAALLALLPAAGHDQMWLLYAARLVLHGAPLYGPQVFETNPPLIIWLSLVPAALAPLTHLPDTALGKLFVLLLEAGIAALCLRLLRLLRPALTPPTLWAFAFITVFAVLPARDLGQRDHFLILFLLPYVLAVAVRAEGLPIPAPLASLIGVLALLGLVLKPHQLLIPLTLESYLLLQILRGTRAQDESRLPEPSSSTPPRSPPSAASRARTTLLRPELLAMALSGLLFLLAVRLFAPLYFTSVLPLARDTYWAYGHLTLAQLLGESIQLHLLAAFNLALFLRFRPEDTVLRVLLLAGAAATVAFYLQGTGWYYQQLPALSLFSLALTSQILDLPQTREPPTWTPKAAAALAVLALALTTHFMRYPFTPDRSFPIDQPDPSFFSNLPPGTPVMTLSPTIDDTLQPIFRFHLTLAQRYPAFLMLPALLRAEDPQGHPIPYQIPPTRLAELDRLQHQYMVEDLRRWHPTLLLVERCQDPAVHCQVLEDRHDDLLAFFLRDPAFAAIFARYHPSRTIGPYTAYTLVEGARY